MPNGPNNKSRKMAEKLQGQKTLLLPDQIGDPRQLWILVRRDPETNSPGCFFVTHAKNFDKFSKRKGHEVLGHSWDRSALALAAHQATIKAGPSHQPNFSVHAQVEETRLAAEAERKELDDLLSDAPTSSVNLDDIIN